MKIRILLVRLTSAVVLAALLASCGVTTSIPDVNITHSAASDKERPYNKVLVVAIGTRFDPRHYFEEMLVDRIRKTGTEAIASTTMMNSKTPMVTKTYLDMLEKTGADALMVTVVQSFDAQATVKDARPEVTHNVWPGYSTFYYNVWWIETTEYVAPPIIAMDSDLALDTEFYSVAQQELVWSIETQIKFTERVTEAGDYRFMEPNTRAIVNAMRAAGLTK